MPVGAIAAIGGGLLQANAAKKAANAQKQAANDQIAFQTETRDQIRADLAPWLQGGGLANQAQLNMLGMGAAPMIGGTAPQIETHQIPGQPGTWQAARGDRGEGRMGAATPPTTGYRVGGQEFKTLQEAQQYANANKTGGTEWSWQTTPGYDFRMQQGLDAIDASAAARGGLYSGAAMQDAMKFGQDYGSAEFGNVFNMLGGLSANGMNAANMSGAASQNAANGVSNALGAQGNAAAAGAVGQANAWNQGIGNALGVFNYQKQMGQGNGSGYNWLFGGSGTGNFF